MANTEIEIPEEDQITTKTLLHEAIPLTGTIVSGTYADNNIKIILMACFNQCMIIHI